MNSFGLGLVLNFTDNASAGMRRASQTFNEMNRISDQMVSASGSAVSSIETLSLAGYGLNVVGDQLANVGSSIVKVFGSASQSVINTGMEVMGFEMQLNALYKSQDLAAQKMQQIQEYARTSVFETRDLISAVTLMKAVGIEAMDAVTTSSGKTTQTLLDYASDISAMFPNMHNAYGTGVNAAMGALKEYIAEGNARSLKAGAGLDITEMLGEDKGKSIEERTRQVADLVEMLGIAGYTASLAGTPTQQLSNMQDALYMAMSKIADSGVLNTYTEMLSIIANYVNDLVEDEDRFNTLTQIMGEIVTAVLTPLKKVAEFLVKLVDSFISFSESHPMLAKTIGIIIAVTGVALVAMGTIMKLSGSFLILFASIKNVSDVLKSGKGIKTFSRLLGGLKANLLPIIAIAGLAYIAWKNNFFGIRDVVTKTFRDIGKVISLTFDAFKDNTLTEDRWNEANELGILPFIESILDLKYYLGLLFDGFSEGISNFLETIGKVTESWGIFDSDVLGTAENLGEFLKNLNQPGAEDTWKSIGEALGKVAGFLLIIVPAIKTVKTIGSIFKTIFAPFKKVGEFLGKFKIGQKFASMFGKIKSSSIIAKLTPVFSDIGAWITKTALPKLGGLILKGLSSLGGLIVAHPIIAVIVAIVAIAVGLIIKYWDEVKTFFINLGAKISEIFNRVKDKVHQIIQSIANFFTPIFDFFASIGRAIWGVIESIVGVVKSKFNLVKTIITSAIKVVVSVFKFFYEVARWVGLSIALFFKKCFDKVVALVQPLIDVIKYNFQFIKDNVLTPLKESFMETWQGIVDFITPIIDGIVTRFQQFVEDVKGVLGIFKDVVLEIFQDICDGISGFFDLIAEIVDWIAEKIGGIGSAISGFFDGASKVVGHFADKKEGELVGAATGGYVKTTGIGVLHPNELVVNDKMTQQLGAFLDNQTALSVAPVPVSASASTKSVGGQNVNSEGYIDNSVTFAAGSVVIQMNNASDAEIEKVAEKLMKIIARKQQLKGMAVRK